MMATRRHPDRPAPAGGADRLRLPARVRRDAAADRPDRRPARPGAGAGRRAGGVRASARWSPRWPTTCRAWSPAGSSRASAAAGWCRPPWPWSPTSTPSSAAASRSASSRRSRSSAASSGRCSARWCSPLADWRAIFLINLAVGAGAGRRDPTLRLAPAGQEAAPRAPRPGGRDPTGSASLLLRHPGRRRAGLRPAASRCMRDLTWGQLFIPFAGDGRWLTPIGVVAMVAARAARGPLR